MTTGAQLEIREETRNAWTTLLEAGETPSVRKVWSAVGGAYNTIVEECRALRGEQKAATGATETPEGCPVQDADAMTVGEAETALDAARQAQARAVQAAQEAEADHARCEEQVRTFERQMLAGVLVQDALVAARRDRTEAYLRMGDMQALVNEAEAFVAPAEADLAAATRRAELVAYNTLAAGRAPLLAAVQTAVAQLEAALEPLLTHHAQQVAQAEHLGFADLLTATPFSAASGDARNLTAYSVLGFWLYTHLARLLPPSSPDIDVRHRLRVDDLATVDAAWGHLLTWDQFLQVTAPARQVQVRLLANPTPEGSNLLALAEAGLPGVLSPLAPVVLPWAAVEVLRQSCPALQVVGDLSPRELPASGPLYASQESLQVVGEAGGE